jgi:hypothetical protein
MNTALHPDQIRALDYLARKGTAAPVEKLRTQLRDAFTAIEAAFDAVEERDMDRAPAPGKWSAHQILDHLVLSHAPAVAQFELLLAGVSPEQVAVPADLQSPPGELAAWSELRTGLGDVHRRLLDLMDAATDNHSLAPRAVVEMVIKVDGKTLHWLVPVDWKAFIQALRVHTVEHQGQLQRTLDAIR